MSVPRPTTAPPVGRSARVVRGRHRRFVAIATVVIGSLALAVLVVGLAFAGSPDKLPAGVRIAGVDVGGLTPHAARVMLARRSARLARVPVTFVAGSGHFAVNPTEMGVTVDWGRAVADAAGQGDGSGIVRGFRRLALRFSPAEIEPVVHAYGAAVNYEVGLLGSKIDRPHREARLVRHGLTIQTIGGESGLELQRDQAAKLLVASLASLTRHRVVLPVQVDPPTLTIAQLKASRVKARRILSAPVSLALDGKTTTTLTPRQLAPMLQLPREPRTAPALGGAAANAYFARLDHQVGRPAHGATFAVSGDQVHVVPAVDGLALDVPRSAAAVLTAALRTDNRVAGLVVHRTHTGRTTAAAQAMGITGQVSSYETIYGGIANRIHNVQLVAHLVDDKLIAPGATFSFNGATGERSAAKGFVEAPVIINGELSTGLGGGVCQVSTTVFNAAYEAGLPITARTNHALYISHYPLGRDATVDYPDIDLKFVNDTPHWLLLRTFVGSSSLVVALYGTPAHRRVVSQTSPLRVVSPAPVYRSIDSSLAPGERVVDAYGTPAQSTSVRRLVYAPDGKLLSDSTWYSNYRAEPTVIRIGPKKPKKPKPPPAAKTGGKGQAGAGGATGAAGPLAGQAAVGAGATGADATGIDATGTGSSTTASTTTGSTSTGSTTTDSTDSESTATGSTATGATGSTAATTGTSPVSPAGAR